MSPRSWPPPGSPRIWVSRPTPPRCAAASGTPRPVRPTRGICGLFWPRGGCRNAGSRRRTSWSTGRCWRPTTTCAARTPPRCSCAVFFHQGAPPLSEGALRTEPGLAGLRAAAAAHLSAAGQQQVATALDMLAATEAQLGPLRHQLRDAARRLVGAKVLAERLYGAGPGHRAGADLLAGRGRPVLLLPQGGPVHRAGHHRAFLRPQRTARAAVPAGAAGAALGGV